jgi:hypothetical protein
MRGCERRLATENFELGVSALFLRGMPHDFTGIPIGTMIEAQRDASPL